MCGIAGYLRLDGEPADRGVLRALCDAIVHRGPDAEGLLVEGSAALGMRRLAIIDVAGGDQPMHSRDGDLSIVFNGECYDFEKSRRRLLALGRTFDTRSDTECLLRAHEHDGDDAMLGFRGMFAYALWSRSRNRLLLVRDRVGKKPLHWYKDERVFVFGSEIKSILVALARLDRPRPEVDASALAQYMAYGHIPDPKTAFTGIAKLPPGHRLILEGGGVSIEPYWRLDPTPTFAGTDDEALAELDRRVEESVRLRMISDVPLGAFLSGGVDSSVVVGMMRRVATGPVKTFSIGFDEKEFDELEHARVVARHLGTDHVEEVVRPDAAELIDGIVTQFDEPFADSSAIPTYYVSRMARREVTVALSGDGGDELFYGYHRYADSSSAGLGALPLGLRRLLFGSAARLLPHGFFGRARLRSLALGDDESYVHHLTCGVSDWHRRLYTEEFAHRARTTDPAPVYLDVMRRAAHVDALTRRAFADFLVYLPSDVMTKVDRMSMMVSLESRAPLLDHEVVEFAFSLPTRLKRDERGGKLLLKRLARTLVPASVIDRRKRGFGVPISHWFNAQWMAATDALLDAVCERGIFRRSTVAQLRDEHRRGRRDHSQLLWNLMTLELWYRRYVDDRAFGR